MWLGKAEMSFELQMPNMIIKFRLIGGTKL